MSARNAFLFLTDSFTLVTFCLATLVAYAVFARTEYHVADINGQQYRLEVADTDGERASGLGGRPPLPQDQGMVFIYTHPARQCFWMKDMRYSLDMVWLDAQKQVIHIEHDVSPSSFPQTFCADDTQYVIELNAGQAISTGLATGQKIPF